MTSVIQPRARLRVLLVCVTVASLTLHTSVTTGAHASTRPSVQFDMRPSLFHLVGSHWTRTARVSSGERVRFQLLYAATGSASQPWHSVSAMLLVQRPRHPQATAPAVLRRSMKGVHGAGGHTRFRVTTRIPPQWSGAWMADFQVTGKPGEGTVGQFLPFTVAAAGAGEPTSPPTQLGLTLGIPRAPAHMTENQAVTLARTYDPEIDNHPLIARYGSLDVHMGGPTGEPIGLIDVWEITASNLDIPAPGPKGKPHPVFHQLTIVVDDKGMKVLFGTAH